LQWHIHIQVPHFCLFCHAMCVSLSLFGRLILFQFLYCCHLILLLDHVMVLSPVFAAALHRIVLLFPYFFLRLVHVD
jgi:hypothetical protein